MDMSVRPVSVFLLGASGEVGKEVVKELAKTTQIENVTLIGRRLLDLPKEEGYQKFLQKLVDFDKLSDYAEDFKGHDVGICALGTTRAKSGPEGFYKVDHDYIVNAAKLAKEGGTKHFSLVSSTGSNKDSYFLYPRVKGEVEEEIKDMKFEKLAIYRPGVLLCDREETRTGEAIIRSVFKYIDRWSIWSIQTSSVATAIVRDIFNKEVKPVTIRGNAEIRELAKPT